MLGQTRGKVYRFDEGMEYDDDVVCYRRHTTPPFTFEAWRGGNSDFARHVVPLVSRPAKVGEWVRVRETSFLSGGAEEGDICQVLALHKWAESRPDLYAGAVYVSSKRPTQYDFTNMDRPILSGNFAFLAPSMYEVLEGYDGRFEPAAESRSETAQRVEAKTPCDCYHERENGPHGVIGECWGTREREECSCYGYKELCTFYPEHRKTAAETGGSHETEV